MKRYMIVILIAAVVGALVLTSCKRSSVEEPGMKDTSAFRIFLTGTAHPATLYVPASLPEKRTVIRIKARNNDGTPVANGTIVFQAGDYGYFTGYLVSDTRVTNANGIAEITYFIPPGLNPKYGDTEINIKSTFKDDGRLENMPPLYEVHEYVSVRLIPYDKKEVIRIWGYASSQEGGGFAGLPVIFENAGITVTRSSGSYDFYAPWGWFGTIEAGSLDGYTVEPSAGYTIGFSLYSDTGPYNFVLIPDPVDPTLAATPASFDLTSVSGSGFEIYVFNSTTDDVITIRVQSGADWIHITSPASGTGTTPASVFFSVDPNPSGVNRSSTIEITAISPTGVQGSPQTISVNQEG